MRIQKVDIFDDVYTLTPICFQDERGSFSEVYKTSLSKHVGIDVNIVQTNISESHKNVIRGMHYQYDKPLSKMVSVVKGTIYDVIVDIKDNSPTFGKTHGMILSSWNRRQLWVPPGYAHGFLSLEGGTRVMYQYDELYNKEGEGTINPLEDYIWESYWSSFVGRDKVIISEKDKNAQRLYQYAKEVKF